MKRFLGLTLLASGLALSSGCLAPPPVAQVEAKKADVESVAQPPTDFIDFSWADCSGMDGKGGTKLTVGLPKRLLPLRKDSFPSRQYGDSSTKKHPKWMVFHGENSKSASFEWTWVTTHEDKFWGNMWAGTGIAFGQAWPSIDISAAKYLIFYAKISEPGTETEITVRLDSASKAKGSDQTGEVNTSPYAEGRKIGTDWTRIVIPVKEFPDLANVDITQLKTVVFSLRGRFPENHPMFVRVDDVFFSDADVITPVDNLGYIAAGADTQIVWDKDPNQKIKNFVVKIDGKETKTVEATARAIKLSLPSGSHKVAVTAIGETEKSKASVVEVKVAASKAESATVTVDSRPVHKISKYYNGTNFAPVDEIKDAHFAINRWGGNDRSKYNWKTDTKSSARDWFWLNDFSKAPGTPEEKKAYYLFCHDALEAGTDVNFTVPALPWIAKGAPNEKDRYCTFPVSKWPKQNKTTSEGCGDGKLPGGKEMIWDFDPNVSLVPNSVDYEKGLVENIKKSFGGAGGKGVKFYSIDNEPGLWNDTHRDAVPKGISTDELVDMNTKYATMIKSVDPQAQVIGFIAWGIKELAGSTVDYTPAGPDGYKNFDKAKEGVDRWRDRKAHGDVPQLVSYLKGMKKTSDAAGKRLVDVVDVHWYPEIYYKGTRLSENIKADPKIMDLQFEALREFWDPTFKLDQFGLESWTANADNKSKMWDAFHPLIPVLKKMVEDTYPGTKLAINEYDTGSRDAYNGALLRAATLGIFVQEDLFMAENWYTMDKNSFTFLAHKLFGNYDGKGSGIQGSFVKTTSSNKDLLTYAAQDGAKTAIVVINKNQSSAFNVTIKAPKAAKTVQTYTLSESVGLRILASEPKPVSGDASVWIPAFSAEVVVLQ